MLQIGTASTKDTIIQNNRTAPFRCVQCNQMFICRLRHQHASTCVLRLNSSFTRSLGSHKFANHIANTLNAGSCLYISSIPLHCTRLQHNTATFIQLTKQLTLFDIHLCSVICCHSTFYTNRPVLFILQHMKTANLLLDIHQRIFQNIFYTNHSYSLLSLYI